MAVIGVAIFMFSKSEKKKKCCDDSGRICYPDVWDGYDEFSG